MWSVQRYRVACSLQVEHLGIIKVTQHRDIWEGNEE